MDFTPTPTYYDPYGTQEIELLCIVALWATNRNILEKIGCFVGARLLNTKLAVHIRFP